MSDFYNLFLQLCAKKELSPSGAATKIGLSNAAATGWKTGKIPNDTTLLKLAELFDVPFQYLKDTTENNVEYTKKEPTQKGELKTLVENSIIYISGQPPVTLLRYMYNVDSAVMAWILDVSTEDLENACAAPSKDQLIAISREFSLPISELTRGIVRLSVNPSVLARMERYKKLRYHGLSWPPEGPDPIYADFQE